MTTPLSEQAKNIIKCCRNGHLAQLQELLSQGIDFQLFDNPNFAPLNTALKYGRWQIVRYIFKENALPLNKKTPPIIAAAQHSKDNTTGLEVVFAHTANTEAKDIQGRTALMTAALLGHEKKLAYLLYFSELRTTYQALSLIMSKIYITILTVFQKRVAGGSKL